jgi:hypothetical protein
VTGKDRSKDVKIKERRKEERNIKTLQAIIT